MTVSRGAEGQLISEARICIYSDIKALMYDISGMKYATTNRIYI